MSTESPTDFIPSGADLKNLLQIESTLDLDALFAEPLTIPVGDLFSRPRKSFRDQLVRLGCRIAARQALANSVEGAAVAKDDLAFERIQRILCEILETFHAGSLIVDDIADGSAYRRGAECLHRLYGMPLALNAGNWLYFLPFKYIEDLPVAERFRYALTRECHMTLLRAHYGQALDVGVPVEAVPQHCVAETALAAMELKSGVLTGLALKMGAVVFGCGEEWTGKLDRFGRKLGLALQMLDDVGNLVSPGNPEKKCEDLKLRRLGYVLCVASQTMQPHAYRQLMNLMLDADCSPGEIMKLLEFHGVAGLAGERAKEFLKLLSNEMVRELSLDADEAKTIEALASELAGAYV